MVSCRLTFRDSGIALDSNLTVLNDFIAKTPESGHLIAQGGPSLTQDNNCVLLLNDELMTTGSRAPTGSPNDTSATDLGVMQNFGNYRNNGGAKTYSPANNFVMGNDGPPPPSRQLFPPTTGAGGGGANGTVYPVSVTSTTTGESCGSRMVAAPPPTPLDSRSHRSGLSSSGNSASAYSRSLISGASNSTGPPPPSFTSGGGGGAYAVHGSGGGSGGSIVLNGGALGGQYHHPSEMMGAYNHWVGRRRESGAARATSRRTVLHYWVGYLLIV